MPPGIFIWERIIYLQCELLSGSSATDSEKDTQFKALIDKLNAGPPNDASSVDQPLKTDRAAVLVSQMTSRRRGLRCRARLLRGVEGLLVGSLMAYWDQGGVKFHATGTNTTAATD